MCSAVLAKQAEKKSVLERTEQGKKTAMNRKKRPHPSNGANMESASKRARAFGNNHNQFEVTASKTPSPLTLNNSCPTSVMSADNVNGSDSVDVHGSIDSSEVNCELFGTGTTPASKKSQLGQLGLATSMGEMVEQLQPSQLSLPGSGGGVKRLKRTSAPLGGRGKMQKNVGKKGGSKSGGTGSAAASAGAKAGAKAATSAAYAAYGIPFSPPRGSPTPTLSLPPTVPYRGGRARSSTHSSPRVSPVPMAFVATSLITAQSTNTLSLSSSKTQSSFPIPRTID